METMLSIVHQGAKTQLLQEYFKFSPCIVTMSAQVLSIELCIKRQVEQF